MLPAELQPEFLLSAYANGIFPMGEGDEIAWYSPDPRAVLPLEGFKAPRSLRQRLRNTAHEIRINADFERVMRCCADRDDGTWITDTIVEAYTTLHQLGFAHSVEAYYGKELAGGLYGVSYGGVFFGESMFTCITDGSKVALVGLVERMRARKMTLLDVQFQTQHLSRFGVLEIPRVEYLRQLQSALELDVTFVD